MKKKVKYYEIIRPDQVIEYRYQLVCFVESEDVAKAICKGGEFDYFEREKEIEVEE